MEITTLDEEQKKFMNSWSWGSTLLGFIWALGSKIYIFAILLLVASMVPVVNLIVPLYFGVTGRRLAWQNAKWESFEVYKNRQRLLDKIGLVVLVVAVLLAGYAMMRYGSTELLMQGV